MASRVGSPALAELRLASGSGRRVLIEGGLSSEGVDAIRVHAQA
jgi:hypothetical protein